MNAQQRDGERYRAWIKVQEGRADECVSPTAVRRLAAEYEAQRAAGWTPESARRRVGGTIGT